MIPLLRPTKALPRGQKRVKVGGTTYTIRQVQPADFAPSQIPLYIANPAAFQALPLSQVLREKMLIVAAGVVEPRLVPIGSGITRGREDGITIESLFRDPEHSHALFVEILAHSLNPHRPGIMAYLFPFKFKWEFAQAERAVKNKMRAVGEA